MLAKLRGITESLRFERVCDSTMWELHDDPLRRDRHLLYRTTMPGSGLLCLRSIMTTERVHETIES
jgi:hypothetical protein